MFRCGCALLVFCFHSAIGVGCYYGIVDGYVQMGAVAMTGFFMLSGYVLYHSYHLNDLSNIKNVKSFYLKRCIAILPDYYIVAVLYILFLGEESVLQNIMIAPIEILGLQSVFSSLFGITHNSGTWFISCMLLCYVVFPFLCEMVKQMRNKEKWIVAILISAILLYAPFVVYIFEVQDIYSNPFFRILEFTEGILIASSIEDIRKCDKYLKMFSCGFSLMVELLILIVGISIAYYLGISRYNYMLYSWVALPMFSLLIITLSMMEFKQIKYNERLSGVINYMSKCSYAFFLAQFFTWPMVRKCTAVSDRNIFKIILSFTICMGITILIYEIIEKPSKKILKRILLKE